MKHIQREAGALAVAIRSRVTILKEYRQGKIQRDLKYARKQYRKALYRYHVAAHDPRLNKPWEHYAPKGGRRAWGQEKKQLQNPIAEEARRRHALLESAREIMERISMKQGERALIVAKARQEIQMLRTTLELVQGQCRARQLSIPDADSSQYGEACVEEVLGVWEAQRKIRDYWTEIARQLQGELLWIAA